MLESLWSLLILYSRILGLISSHILFKITQLLSHLVTLRVSCFSWIFKAISSEKSCPTSMPFSLTKTLQFPDHWIMTGLFKFQEHQPYESSLFTGQSPAVEKFIHYIWIISLRAQFSAEKLWTKSKSGTRNPVSALILRMHVVNSFQYNISRAFSVETQ